MKVFQLHMSLIGQFNIKFSDWSNEKTLSASRCEWSYRV